MRTTAALLVIVALTLPSVAMPHPCEMEVAQLKKELDAIRGAIATIEALPPGDTQRQALTGARGKYDLELRRTTEAQDRCERLVREEGSGATPSPQAAAPAPVPVPAPAPAPVVVPAPAPAPAAAVLAPSPEVAPPPPATPCLTGCGKDTDCKGDRICVKGACQDPPSR